MLFPLIWPLIIVAFLSAVTWGMLMGTLFDYRKPLNSWLGGMTAATGVVWVVSMAGLGMCVLLQPQWDNVYIPVTQETARWGHILAVINVIAWFGPQVTGFALIGSAWWVWVKLVRTHFYYVRDTRWRGNA